MFHLNRMIQELKSIDDKYKLWNKKKKTVNNHLPVKNADSFTAESGLVLRTELQQSVRLLLYTSKNIDQLSYDYESRKYVLLLNVSYCHTFLPRDSSFRSIIKSVFNLYFFITCLGILHSQYFLYWYYIFWKITFS